jgi:type VII secretion-associated serine protease mycosin
MRGRVIGAVATAILSIVVFGPSTGSGTGSASVPSSASASVPELVEGPAGGIHTDTVRSGEYWLDQYGIRSAWATTQGKGITIAVIDTGVDGSVPDLAGAVSGGTDFSGDGSNNGQTPEGDADERNHGTMVASLAAGRGTGDGGGLIGVAPRAKILTISIGFGAQATNSDDQIANAVTWAVNHGANVINMSLTRNTLSWPPSWDKAFLYAMDHNVVIVAAAGNRGSGTSEVGAPATMPGVLTVAGVDRSGHSSVDASAQGITIGVSAPSEQLLGAVPGGGYVQWEGTSGSTPIVAGVVALVMAAHPGISADNAINRVVSTATDAGAKGVDPIYGYGLVNAAAAVRNSVPSVSKNPMGSLSAWIHLNRRAEATTTPTTPPTSVATAAPKAGASMPQNPLGALYPTPTQLRNVGIPLGIILAFVVAALAMLVLAVRQFGRLRRRR